MLYIFVGRYIKFKTTPHQSLCGVLHLIFCDSMARCWEGYCSRTSYGKKIAGSLSDCLALLNISICYIQVQTRGALRLSVQYQHRRFDASLSHPFRKVQEARKIRSRAYSPYSRFLFSKFSFHLLGF